ncbi:hypothetical protein BH11BAC3_BH11BAC3_34790 [soil metagenome]
MTAKILALILFSCLFTCTYSQASLIGKWRRVNDYFNNQDTVNRDVLEICKDSTFHIEGDSSSQNSTISGWNIGEEYNGTWELRHKNRLFLWMEPKKDKMFLWYIIVKLTKDKLILRLGFTMNDKKHDITYIRI